MENKRGTVKPFYLIFAGKFFFFISSVKNKIYSTHAAREENSNSELNCGWTKLTHNSNYLQGWQTISL